VTAANPGVQKLVFGGVFPVGLMLVAIGGGGAVYGQHDDVPAAGAVGAVVVEGSGNLVPVTLGNIAGGAVFVGLGYWAVYMDGGRARQGG
jgi:formate/nitrite transporter FocA (FNT family)